MTHPHQENVTLREPALHYENEVFMTQVNAAMDHVTSALGHEVWSRDLDDHIVSYAFCVSKSVYDNKRMCRALRRWLKAVFAHYGIDINTSKWLQSSDNKFDDSFYTVDWCGSRCRSVNIGPHLYLEPDWSRSRGCHPGPPPPIEKLWHTYCIREDTYNYTMRVVEAADAAELDFIKRREQFRDEVILDATTKAWMRLRGKRIPVVANCPNDWSCSNYEWTQIYAPEGVIQDDHD